VRRADKKRGGATARGKMPHVVRLKVPEEGITVFHDLVYGKIEVENKNMTTRCF